MRKGIQLTNMNAHACCSTGWRSSLGLVLSLLHHTTGPSQTCHGTTIQAATTGPLQGAGKVLEVSGQARSLCKPFQGLSLISRMTIDVMPTRTSAVCRSWLHLRRYFFAASSWTTPDKAAHPSL
ncbi:hypothetical protein K402DRAFT_12728 [Aulographum hederae CBS 113979]|uniref:Uncharacterized protein n=1 Tax=Aulographum hederae CBS 113979 TaxID=1176131 RepID=A0A6G1H7N4_9PEZI|nr:hypothetical protein K402DRAFT_12728 [Aulographum hederae CBS 113979]